MELILTRHGETNWNIAKKIQGKQDIELNETGIQQARQLAEKISKENLRISKIYASKQKRAKVTAKIVSDTLNLPLEEMDGLEEMNLGLWEGLTWNEVKELYPMEFNEWLQNRRFTKTPQGESYQELLERTLRALKEIVLKEKKEKKVLIVTHSAVIMVLMCYLHNTPFEEMVEKYNIKNAEMIMIEDKDICLRTNRFIIAKE